MWEMQEHGGLETSSPFLVLETDWIMLTSPRHAQEVGGRGKVKLILDPLCFKLLLRYSVLHAKVLRNRALRAISL